ncbi:MAG: hypothetical protein JXR37_33705 [Kiritimatiellae bacterium]|nr:hypothetical protein [Kiritimatiellia bacterium]
MRTDLRKKWLTLAAVACVSVLALDRLVVSPLTRLFRNRRTRIAELREAVSQGTLLLGRAESMRERWGTMTREALPASNSTSEEGVLKAMSQWAGESRITYTSLTPQWRQHEDGYQTLECRATAEGDLQSITRFLHALERAPMSVRLEGCELTAKDQRGERLVLNARLSALRLPRDEDATP